MTCAPFRGPLAVLVSLLPAFLGAPPAGAAAGPDTLADGTWVDRWTLRNGLEVSVRHVPEGNAVAVITAYRVGRNQDPGGREGLADLVGEVLLTAGAGDIPERSREELAGIRPRGWNLQITPRFTLTSEVASPAQFPGLLRQVATRMRGVTVTDSNLARALATVTRELGERYLGSPELTLYNQLRDVAQGVSDEDLVRRVSGRPLRNVTAAEVGERLRRLYVPANAVLALAGDLEGVDVRALVATLFEDIPAGTVLREPPEPRLKAGTRTLRRHGLDWPTGVVGILGPRIDDPLHPNFYLNALVMGRYCEKAWGPAPAPLQFRFRYPLFADPDLVQFFPPVAAGDTDPERLRTLLLEALGGLAGSIVDAEVFQELRLNHAWLLGGPMTPSLLNRIRLHSGTLHTLASTMAVHALWGSRGFWEEYLERFMDERATGGNRWTEHFSSPDQMVRLLLTPARR